MKNPIDIKTLKNQLSFPGDYNFEIICHPDNLEWLKVQLNTKESETGGTYLSPLTFHSPFGIPIKVDENLPIFEKRWKFPASPFIEYEKKMRFGQNLLTLENM